eukprot:6202752-Pleurochrysis_carterae.AAC.2
MGARDRVGLPEPGVLRPRLSLHTAHAISGRAADRPRSAAAHRGGTGVGRRRHRGTGEEVGVETRAECDLTIVLAFHYPGLVAQAEAVTRWRQT